MFGGIEKNPAFITIFIITMIIQVVCIQTPMNLFFGCTYLGWEQWVWCVCLGAGCLVWQFLINAVLVLLDKCGFGHELPPMPHEEGLFHGGQGHQSHHDLHDAARRESKEAGSKYAPSMDAAELGGGDVGVPPPLPLKTPGEIGRDMAGGQQVDDWNSMKGKSKLNAPEGSGSFNKAVGRSPRRMSPGNSPRLTPRSEAAAQSTGASQGGGKGGNKVMPMA